jgi:hypothetical protein
MRLFKPKVWWAAAATVPILASVITASASLAAAASGNSQGFAAAAASCPASSYDWYMQNATGYSVAWQAYIRRIPSAEQNTSQPSARRPTMVYSSPKRAHIGGPGTRGPAPASPAVADSRHAVAATRRHGRGPKPREEQHLLGSGRLRPRERPSAEGS